MSLSIYSETERLVSLYQSYYYQYLEYHFRTSRGVKTTLLGMSKSHFKKCQTSIDGKDREESVSL